MAEMNALIAFGALSMLCVIAGCVVVALFLGLSRLMFGRRDAD